VFSIADEVVDGTATWINAPPLMAAELLLAAHIETNSQD
jgi:hypothetical protein